MRRSLGAEHPAKLHRALQVFADIRSVVDDVRAGESAAVLSLLRSLQAEVQVIRRDSIPLEDAVGAQALARLLLNVRLGPKCSAVPTLSAIDVRISAESRVRRTSAT
jgi:hypothetical protein